VVVVFPLLSIDTTCCACPVAAACFFAAAIALSCCDAQPANINTASVSAPPIVTNLDPTKPLVIFIAHLLVLVVAFNIEPRTLHLVPVFLRCSVRA
jgi:hypothetical protein